MSDIRVRISSPVPYDTGQSVSHSDTLRRQEGVSLVPVLCSLAQRLAHHLDMVGVKSSNLLGTTMRLSSSGQDARLSIWKTGVRIPLAVPLLDLHNGNALVLHTRVGSSILSSSTIFTLRNRRRIARMRNLVRGGPRARLSSIAVLHLFRNQITGVRLSALAPYYPNSKKYRTGSHRVVQRSALVRGTYPKD